MARISAHFTAVDPKYCDYNSTTPLPGQLLARLPEIFGGHWANPSSQHAPGKKSAHDIANLRRKLAAVSGRDFYTATFCASATEAMNLAIASLLEAVKEGAIGVSGVEHSCVSGALKRAEGVRVVSIPVKANGQVDVGALKLVIRDPKVQMRVVAVQAANNETGVVQPISEIAEAISGQAVLLVDGSQIFGKSADWFDCLSGADLIVLSPHKFYGPKGVGVLIHPADMKIAPIIVGGGQEGGRRSGTENVPALALANEWIKLVPSLESDQESLKQERDAFEAYVLASMPGAKVLGSGAARLGNTSAIYLPGVSSEAVLVRLDAEGWSVSTGSACNSGAMEPSHVYQAYGYDWKQAKEILRVSFGLGNEVGVGKLLAEAIERLAKEILYAERKALGRDARGATL